MNEHFSLDRSRLHVFLPINLQGAGAYVGNGFTQHSPRLAVVDRSLMQQFPALHTFLWKTTPTGTVWRQYTDRDRRDEKGRAFRVNEQLLLVVRSLPPFTPVIPRNTDPLDCRAENVLVAPSLACSREAAVEYTPGSVVSTLEGYNEALNDIRSFPGKYTSVLQRSRAPKLDAIQLSALLQAVLVGPMKGQSARAIAEWSQSELGVRLTIQNVNGYIRGKTSPVHGFDYKALAATRMNPRERALERWKERNA